MDNAYAAAYPDLYRNHWWWRAREEILLAEIAALLEGVAHARVLDVGCGAGLFFDALQRFGEVEGIESDAAAVQRAGKWRSRIHQGELDGRFAPRAPYDLVLLLDVLEHVPEPGELLRRAAALLADRGAILITVPAFNWLWTKHDDLNHHLHRYTVREMTHVIHAAGLRTAAASYLFPSLVVPKALVRLTEAIFKSAPAVPGIPPAPVNRAAQAVLRLEYALGRWVPFGTSVLAVATRRA